MLSCTVIASAPSTRVTMTDLLFQRLNILKDTITSSVSRDQALVIHIRHQFALLLWSMLNLPVVKHYVLQPMRHTQSDNTQRFDDLECVSSLMLQ